MEQQYIVRVYGTRILEGALAGLVATAPMSVFMLLAQRLLPKRQQYALPPERITTAFLRRIGVKKNVNQPEVKLASFLNHFLYGSLLGTCYPILMGKLPLPTPLKGPIFGLTVWAISYLGLIPALKLPASEAAQKQSAQRNLLMIGAHIIWGSTVEGISQVFEERFSPADPALRFREW